MSIKFGELLKVGEVCEVLPEKHMCRVVFPCEGNNTSYELFVLCRNSLKNKDYNMPDVGEDVLCIFMPDGSEDGFILGSYYAENLEKCSISQDERKVKFSDDTTVTYNRVTHCLDIVIEGTSIHADRKTVNVITPQTVNIQTNNANIKASNVKVDTSSSINLNAGSSINISAGSSITLSAPTVTAN